MRCKLSRIGRATLKRNAQKPEKGAPVRFLVSVVGAGLVLLGCGEAREPSVWQRTVEKPVLGGEKSDRREVVYVRATGGAVDGACSGTVVAPNLVLTARHCVSAFVNGEYVCSIDGDIDGDFPRSPEQAGEMGLLYGPGEVKIFVGLEPDFSEPAALNREIIAPETDTICRNDVAFVVLDRELELPLGKLRRDSGLVPGETMVAAGYGLNEAETTQRREVGGLELLGVGPSEFYEVEGQSPPRTFVVGRGPCPGDSGGPAFSEPTGDVVGVYSLYRGGDCSSEESRNFYTQVAAFDSVIQEAFEVAGHEELLQVPMEVSAGGGAGGSGVDDGGGAAGGCSAAASPGDPVPARGIGALLLLVGSVLWRRRNQLGS